MSEPIENLSSHYHGCMITNFRRGKGERGHIIYCNLVDKDGVVLICASLDYICEALHERIPLED